MKFLIDENTPIQYVGVLKFVLGQQHTVDHVSDLQWKSKKDLASLADAHRRGYQIFITNDRNQLNDPAETKAILRSGMHHVLYSRAGVGLSAQAYALASVTVALQRSSRQRMDRLSNWLLPCVRSAAIRPTA